MKISINMQNEDKHKLIGQNIGQVSNKSKSAMIYREDDRDLSCDESKALILYWTLIKGLKSAKQPFPEI